MTTGLTKAQVKERQAKREAEMQAVQNMKPFSKSEMVIAEIELQIEKHEVLLERTRSNLADSAMGHAVGRSHDALVSDCHRITGMIYAFKTSLAIAERHGSTTSKRTKE